MAAYVVLGVKGVDVEAGVEKVAAGTAGGARGQEEVEVEEIQRHNHRSHPKSQNQTYQTQIRTRQIRTYQTQIRTRRRQSNHTDEGPTEAMAEPMGQQPV